MRRMGTEEVQLWRMIPTLVLILISVNIQCHNLFRTRISSQAIQMVIVNSLEISLTPLVAVVTTSSSKTIMMKKSPLTGLRVSNIGQLKRNRREEFSPMALIIELSSSCYHTLESWGHKTSQTLEKVILGKTKVSMKRKRITRTRNFRGSYNTINMRTMEVMTKVTVNSNTELKTMKQTTWNKRKNRSFLIWQ